MAAQAADAPAPGGSVANSARGPGEAIRAPDIHLRLLRYFVVAAEEENFNRAAERLNLAQSALSRRMRDLEQELGVALFERRNKRVRLSAAGRAFLVEARHLIQLFGEAAARCRALARSESNSLRIGINDTALRHDKLSRALRRFHAAYPEVDLQVRPTTPLSLIEAVLDGQVDGAFIYTRPEASDLIGHVEVARERFLLALPSGHRLSQSPHLRLRDLASEEFLWMPRESAPRVHDRMTEACLAGGLTPRISQHLLSESSRLHLVGEEMGVTFVTSAFADFLPSRVTLREVEDFSLNLSLDFVWRRENTSYILADFVEIVADLSRS